MSRDFKQEYTQYMNEQTPDLWARIEANLPAKETTAMVETETSEDNKVKFFSLKNSRMLTYGMTAAAALLVCVLALPTLRGLSVKNQERDNAASYDGAARFAADLNEGILEVADETASPEEECEGYAVEMAEDAGAGNIASEEAVSEHKQEYGGVRTEELSGSTSDATTDSVNEEVMDEMNAVSSPAEKTATETEEIVNTEAGTMQTAEAKVLENYTVGEIVVYRVDADGVEVRVVFGEEFSEDAILLIGGVYRLRLKSAEEDSDWDYVIVEVLE